MRPVLWLPVLALSATAAAAQSNASLLAPADPRLHGDGPRYGSVTAGLPRYRVVEPTNWLDLNRAVGPQPAGTTAGTKSGSRGNAP